MSSRRLALIAFALHAPGLRVVAGYGLHRRVLIANAIAIAVTVTAMALVGWRIGSPASVVIVWATGHLAWSCYLAALAFAGRLGAPVAGEAPR